MTLSTQTSKAAFMGNGVTTVFPLPFPFQREADIKALLRRDGAETPLLPGSHYSLSGAGSAQGGSLTLRVPAATGETLLVYRAPAIVQEVDYVENSAFPAETHEAALDLLTMICQALQEQISRAVLYPVSTPQDEVLDSAAFLDAAQANRIQAQTAAQGAGESAASAGDSAELAAASAALATEIAATATGLVKVSAGDALGGSLSAKLAAGDGLAETLLNPGAAESLRLSVALAPSSGLAFASGLLRVQPGPGLSASGAGLAVDTGPGSAQIPTNQLLRPAMVAARVLNHALHGGF